MTVILEIISGALVGPSVRTALFYTLTYLFDKQFKEPVLLNKLLRYSHFYDGRHVWPGFGWLIHYSVGVIRIMTYHVVWMLTSVNPTILTAAS